MQNVVGVRFQEAGKIYYFSPAGFENIEVGEYVVVETSRGLEVCRVVIAPAQVVNAELTETLKPIVRLAFQEDLERMQILKAKATDDVAAARRAVTRLRLPIKIVTASYNLDGTTLTVYFNPAEDQRVDLRDLLKEVQAEIGAQVQLRQVGARDQAKAVDGYGICGRRLCCSAWLTSFPAISIRMAKEQNLPLNPNKISGECGRLLCCIAYENDMYKELKAELPRVGTLVSTPAGDATVVGVNALRQLVSLRMQDYRVVDMPSSALAMELGVVRVIAEPDPEPEPDLVVAAPVIGDDTRPRRPEPDRRPQGDRRPGPPPRRPAPPMPPPQIEARIERREPADGVNATADAEEQARRRRRRRPRGRGPGGPAPTPGPSPTA